MDPPLSTDASVIICEELKPVYGYVYTVREHDD
jgi:hypothetical protein